MPDPEPGARLKWLEQAGLGLKLVVLGCVSAGVGFLLGGLVNVSFQSNPVAWVHRTGRG